MEVSPTASAACDGRGFDVVRGTRAQGVEAQTVAHVHLAHKTGVFLHNCSDHQQIDLPNCWDVARAV